MAIAVHGGCIESGFVIGSRMGAAVRKPYGAPREETERRLHTTPTGHTQKMACMREPHAGL